MLGKRLITGILNRSGYLLRLEKSSHRTIFTLDKISKMYREQFYPHKPKPPYHYVCQIGDPVLRDKTESFDPALIKSPMIQEIIKVMWKVQEAYECFGLSAPQIGVPLSMFVIKVTPELIKNATMKMPQVTPIPARVAINPVVKVLDYKKVPFPECCASVRSFTADVPRYTRIRIEAWDENGNQQSWEARDFEARVIQHEMDHLAGVLFTDRMDRKTLSCTAWQYVNMYGGKIAIPYGPQKKKAKWKEIFDKWMSFK